MMLTRRLVLRQKLPRIARVTFTRHSSSGEVQTNYIGPLEVRLSPHKPLSKRRAPFVKNLFLGKYDTEFAAFPEPQNYDRHKEFFEWLKPIEDFVTSNVNADAIDKSRKIPQDVIDQLKDLDVLRAAVPDEYKGLGLNFSEISKLIETLSHVPPLGAYLAKQAHAVSLIANHASDIQKEIYLTKIAAGEIIPTVCMCENTQGPNGAAIECFAERSADDKFWILNGSKTFVSNAENSNLFLVFADYYEQGRNFKAEDRVTAFLVEKDFGGITVHEPIDTMGLRGHTLSQVTFNNTPVPMNNLVGELGAASELFTNIFSEGKEFIGSQAIGLTKNFLQLLIKSLKSDPDFNATIFKNEMVQEIIGKISCNIFAMESVVYMTTGIVDTFANQDCNVEKCIVEYFCNETCVQSLLMGVPLLGSSSFIRGSGIERLLRDAMCLTSFDGSVLNTKAVIALQGLQYNGRETHEIVRIKRNPSMFPKKVLEMMLRLKKNKKLYIADNLHPSLIHSATMLEETIFKFENVIGTILIRYGLEVISQKMVLCGIADVASYLYVIAAILARSSRSYCLGFRDSELEVKMAQIHAYVLYQKAKVLVDQLEHGNWINGDHLIKEIADTAFEKDKYFVEHPLARAF